MAESAESPAPSSVTYQIEMCDKKLIPLSKAALELMGTLFAAIGNAELENEVIPYDRETPTIVMMKIVEWCEHHKNDVIPGIVHNDGSDPFKTDEMSLWDTELLEDLDTIEDGLRFTVEAANYLEISTLYRYTCKFIYDNHVKGKTTEEIREYFCEVDDFTDEDRKKLEAENKWFS
ncbi:hypothetical protein L596_018754 [Steinernema carpocapsae]|uniref:Skp1-related protein n=1 Tax=Steinernema carpocapsae TaxID=34508 RepID=A0A4U5N6E6_STECR|nr:hypothetical protein L596_018754 [Steinernema carpocapsae]